MATVVGLTEGQIARLLKDLEQVESDFKAMYEELAQLPVPGETLNRFALMHNRFSSTLNFVNRQQELIGSDRRNPPED